MLAHVTCGPTLYLHVGTNKTATTTIQARLAASPDALARRGLLYPKAGRLPSGAHHVLAAAMHRHPPPDLRDVPPLAAQLEELEAEVAAARPRGVVVSSEMLWRRERHRPEAMDALLQRFPRTVVVLFVRRQDAWHLSRYNSLQRRRGTASSFADFVRRRPVAFLEGVERWAERVGAEAMRVRPFVPEAWRDGDVTSEFLAQLDTELQADDLADAPLHNPSLRWDVVEVLRLLGEAPIPDRERLVGLLERRFAERSPEPPPPPLTEDLFLELRARHAEENRRLAADWFRRDEAEALAFPADPPASTGSPDVELADVLPVLSEVWRQRIRLGNHVSALRRRVGRLERRLAHLDRGRVSWSGRVRRLLGRPSMPGSGKEGSGERREDAREDAG